MRTRVTRPETTELVKLPSSLFGARLSLRLYLRLPTYRILIRAFGFKHHIYGRDDQHVIGTVWGPSALAGSRPGEVKQIGGCGEQEATFTFLLLTLWGTPVCRWGWNPWRAEDRAFAFELWLLLKQAVSYPLLPRLS